METLSIVTLALCAVAMVYCLWGIYCNEVTFKQRGALIASLKPHYGTDDVWKMFAALDKVTYDDHYKALMRFEDPFKLYDEILFKEVKAK